MFAFFWNTFIGQICMTVLIAMVPLIELRGAIPVGMGAGLEFWQAFIAGVIGNMIPVPFIILFIRKIFAWMRAHGGWMERIVVKMEQRVESKKEVLYKYEVFGLFFFVAIPLPGTGAWTGSLIAAILNIRKREAVPIIALGVVAAGLVVTALSQGVISVVK